MKIAFLLLLPLLVLTTRSDALQEIAIPTQSEWTDHGTILSQGPEGSWDHLLYGGFSASVIKKNGTYYLYYQGAKDYNEKYGTVTWRSIGVATSSDGIHFTKSPENPTITWYPFNWLEEGAVSSAVTLVNDTIVMFYGANTKKNDYLVNADARVATSPDGIHFNDIQSVLNHRNPAVWGAGDELFPIITFKDNDQWFVYYIPNGTVRGHQLGVAWGPSMTTLEKSKAVVDMTSSPIRTWGTGGCAKIGPDTYAIILNNIPTRQTEVRIVSPAYPAQATMPLVSYQFPEVAQATIYLDHEKKQWFMFYRITQTGGYGVKTAPVRKLVS